MLEKAVSEDGAADRMRATIIKLELLGNDAKATKGAGVGAQN